MEQMSLERSRTETAFPRNASIDSLFEHQAAQRPEAISLEYQTTRWTYQQLSQRSNQIAHCLREAGAHRDSLVGICMERSANMIAGMLAILKAGAAYVPIDPTYPQERRSLMLESVPLLLTTKKLAGEFLKGSSRVICVDEESVLQASTEKPPSQSDGESLAYVIYTSGSTGRPKGVAVMHRGIVRLFRNSNFLAIKGSDGVAQTLNVCFDASVLEIWGALVNGARLVILDQETAWSPSRLQRELELRDITVLMLTTAHFNLIAREAPAAFAKMRYVVFGGEAADPRSAAAVLKHGPPKHLLNAYGPTEASVTATCFDIQKVPAGTSIPIGRPISNTSIYLLDGRRNLVPMGAVGEIYIGGAGVARGYLGAPELTAECFLEDPFSTEPGARLYKTGDLGRWLPDGTMELIGRVDTQVKIRGFRIEPNEIEAVLKEHPAVHDAVVMARTNESGAKRLIAYAAGDLSRLMVTELRDLLKKKLPDYMLPTAIVLLEKFPLNAHGKIDRRALPEPVVTRGHQALVEPRDTLETKLARLWERALGVKPIGVTDDFFEIGGDSLLAVRIFAEVERTLGKSLPLATWFQTPTIEKLAAALRRQGWKPSWSPIVAIQSRGSRPPFFCVHGGFGGILSYGHLARCLGADQPLYGLQAEGLEGGPIKHPSIEAMAALYIKEMRKVQVNGPYLFGGYSFGGVVAFEIAQQLRMAGEEVALVVLFDTFDPRNRARRYSLAERIETRLQARELTSRAAKLRFLVQCGLDKLGTALASRHRNIQKLLQKGKQLNGGGSFIELRALHVVRRANQQALAAYKFRPYPGPITYFRAEHPERGNEYAAEGWAKLAKGGIQICEVPGEHQVIFAQPNVCVLAEKLDTCIRSALAPECGSE